MNAEQIEFLEAALDDGNFQVYVMRDASLKQVVRVEPLPPPNLPFDADPTPVAYLANGDWIALANFEISAFYMVQPLSDLDILNNP